MGSAAHQRRGIVEAAGNAFGVCCGDGTHRRRTHRIDGVFEPRHQMTRGVALHGQRACCGGAHIGIAVVEGVRQPLGQDGRERHRRRATRDRIDSGGSKSGRVGTGRVRQQGVDPLALTLSHLTKRRQADVQGDVIGIVGALDCDPPRSGPASARGRYCR